VTNTPFQIIRNVKGMLRRGDRASDDLQRSVRIDFAQRILKQASSLSWRPFLSCRFLALLGHGAMSDLGPLCAQERTWKPIRIVHRGLRLALGVHRLLVSRTRCSVRDCTIAANVMA
jgi:hypothetical protein